MFGLELESVLESLSVSELELPPVSELGLPSQSESLSVAELELPPVSELGLPSQSESVSVFVLELVSVSDLDLPSVFALELVLQLELVSEWEWLSVSQVPQLLDEELGEWLWSEPVLHSVSVSVSQLWGPVMAATGEAKPIGKGMVWERGYMAPSMLRSG